jgi:hydrogenase-1 operon protein HyaF
MSRLTDIPVRIEAQVPGGLGGGGIAALLSEIANVLEGLAQGGQAVTIDLRSLPMSTDDRIALQRSLGDGEVRATLTAQGSSSIRETAVAGVWWVEHCNPQGVVIAELLEVTCVPGILAASLEEIAASAGALRSRGDSSGAPPPGRWP